MSTSKDQRSQQISVVIIGRSHADEFRELLRRIQNTPNLLIVGHYNTIEDALCGKLNEQPLPEMAIVLQAFSDEYSAADAGQLVGRMLFKRVFCCYSPWCLSDGRSHDIWPVVARVPVASAWSLIRGEIQQIQTGKPALLPMAAAEEVFSHRCPDLADQFSTTEDAFLIAVDDHALRDTVVALLRPNANQVFGCGTSNSQIRTGMRSVNATRIIHGNITVLLDIDGQENRERELLELVRSELPASKIVRLTSFPHANPNQHSFDQIVDKLEIANQLFQTPATLR